MVMLDEAFKPVWTCTIEPICTQFEKETSVHPSRFFADEAKMYASFWTEVIQLEVAALYHSRFFFAISVHWISNCSTRDTHDLKPSL